MREQHATPLILFTPKSLLRFPASFSTLDELASGGFRPFLDDAGVSDKVVIERIILSAGKVAYDLHTARAEKKDTKTALLRLEQFYPFPSEGLRQLLASYPSIREVVWVQEEPQNIGGWTFVAPRLTAILPANVSLRYAGRAPSASPATGNANVHKKELSEVLAYAFS
jgi:2-oxoglutarate decarboxylase